MTIIRWYFEDEQDRFQMTGTVEVADDATSRQIDAAVQGEILSRASWGWAVAAGEVRQIGGVARLLTFLRGLLTVDAA